MAIWHSNVKKYDSIAIDYGIYIHWVFLTGCNFACPYCLIGETHRKAPAKAVDIERIMKRIDKIPETILITFTGGEPFLIPNFVELLKRITEKHLVRLDTNLSIKRTCETILKEIDPSRIWEITYSTHIEERETRNMHLEQLCDTVGNFRSKGFRMIGNYVAYPPLLNRMEKDLSTMWSKDIEVYPTLFWGYYQDRYYPVNEGKMQYDSEALALIKRYNPQAFDVLEKSYKSICMAGSRGFLIDHKYNVFPCGGSKRRLGDFFEDWDIVDKALTCCVDFCHGPFNKDFDRDDTRPQQHILNEKTKLKLGHHSLRKSMKYFLDEGDSVRDTRKPISRASRHRRP